MERESRQTFIKEERDQEGGSQFHSHPGSSYPGALYASCLGFHSLPICHCAATAEWVSIPVLLKYAPF